MDQNSAEYERYLEAQRQIAARKVESQQLLDALLDKEIKAIKSKIKELGIKPRQLFSAAVLTSEMNEAPESMAQKMRIGISNAAVRPDDRAVFMVCWHPTPSCARRWCRKSLRRPRRKQSPPRASRAVRTTDRCA